MEKVSNLLKAFVIGAGVLLFGGIVVLTAMIVMRATGGGGEPPPAAQGPVELRLPVGARVEQVVPGGGRVFLLGVDAAGQQFLAVVDPETGQRLSLIRIRPDG